jgi:hypothetical protein
MRKIGTHKGWIGAAAVVLVLALAAALGIGGCAASKGSPEGLSPSTTHAGATTTVGAVTTRVQSGEAGGDETSGTPSLTGSGGEFTGTLTALELASSEKVISDAQLEIEVEAGKFQSAFDQALLLADRYGGYVVSSGSQASGQEGTMQSGTIAVRVPAVSFSRTLSDAAKLGEVKNRQVQTQDVTEEYVDLRARITNSQAHVKALLDLLARAKTVDEILQVQQVLTQAQQQLEELRGRLHYLDEHTSYSTITTTIYETGVTVTPPGEWGIAKAFKDALHNLVNAVNAIVRGLGVLIPVLVVLGIIAYIVYRIWRGAVRRRREPYQERYQTYPQGWSAPMVPQGPIGESGPAPTGQPAEPGPVSQAAVTPTVAPNDQQRER